MSHRPKPKFKNSVPRTRNEKLETLKVVKQVVVPQQLRLQDRRKIKLVPQKLITVSRMQLQEREKTPIELLRRRSKQHMYLCDDLSHLHRVPSQPGGL